MQIKLIKPAMDRAIGAVVTVNDDHGADLISRGYGVKVVEIHTKAIASVETKEVTDGIDQRRCARI